MAETHRLESDDWTPNSPESRLYVEKAARCVAEIQPGVSNVSDVAIFLEILGYDDKDARQHGFADVMALSNYVFNLIDCYQTRGTATGKGDGKSARTRIPVASLKSRFVQALSGQAPWMGALIMLNLTGISLWMAKGLPNDIATIFVAGVFSGLILSEGLTQTFSRLLYMYYDQRNAGEVNRVLIRSYLSAAAFAGIIGLIGFTLFSATNLPASFALLFVGIGASIVLHRVSFNVMYTLKMSSSILAAYACGFTAIFVVFYFAPFAPGTTLVTKYFAALGSAFTVLCAFSLHSHVVALRKLANKEDGARPMMSASIPFYKPHGSVKHSLPSQFAIQAWESIAFFASGILFFVMLFGDRILAWFFNPHRLFIAGAPFPFAFNSEYHTGADIALLVLVPAAIAQYLLISPLYARVRNLAMDTPLLEMQKLSGMVIRNYKESLLIVLATVGLSVLALNLIGQELIPLIKGTNDSLVVMRVASIGNLALSVFTTNLIFLTYLNRSNLAAKMIGLAAAITIILGILFAQQYGATFIAYGYLGSALFSAVLSTVLTHKFMRNGIVRSLARFS